MRAHRPADYAAAPGVEHHREIQEAAPGRHVGDVGHPELVRSIGGKFAPDEIRRSRGFATSSRGAHETTPTDALQAQLYHHPSDSLAAHRQALFGEIVEESGGPIRALGKPVKLSDPRRQRRILARSLRRLAIQPRVVAAGGDLQHSALRGYGIVGLMRSHEFEDPDGIEPVSRANQTAAFDRISRSVFSCFTSRRRRPRSSRSALVKSSARRP